MVDTWHWQCGTTDFNRDLALIDSIPGKHLRHVQFADAPGDVYPGNVVENAGHRLFPGDGRLEIVAMLQAVRRRGGLQTVGSEVVGSAVEGLSADEIGRRSGETTREVLLRSTDDE
jgi:sugar phosphate isomerase/epimerase